MAGAVVVTDTVLVMVTDTVLVMAAAGGGMHEAVPFALLYKLREAARAAGGDDEDDGVGNGGRVL